MCLADLYREREPLPGIVAFPVLSGIQDVMNFRLDGAATDARRDSRGSPVAAPSLMCSAGVWESTLSRWRLRAFEREYCRVVQGCVRIGDQRGRSWEFAAGSAYLLLRGFQGEIEVLDPVRIVYVIFSLPEGGALDWCMTSEGRTALGRDRLEN